MTDLTMGQRIADCRKKAGLSQEALGEKLGVSRQAISKWEADGAVPEVDKLITLSKLFGVSVGWLLGVEEQCAQTEAQDISDELLYKIEQIVKQYQPRQAVPAKRPHWVTAIAVVAVAAVAIAGLVGVAFFRDTPDQSGQIANLNTKVSALQSQLTGLESRIENAAAMPKGFSLSQYHFDIEPHEQDPTAIITFTAVPGTWHADNQASLVARWDNRDYLVQKCAWDGSGLLAVMPIKIQDGYEYWLRVEYPDGTQEQLKLTEDLAEQLGTHFDIEITATVGAGQFDLENGTLELLDYEVSVERPYLLETCSNLVAWQSIDLQLYHTASTGSRELIETIQLFDPAVHEGDEYKEGNERMQIHSLTYPTPHHLIAGLPEIQVGDSIDLWVRVEMSNGIVTTQCLNRWAYYGENAFLDVWTGNG